MNLDNVFTICLLISSDLDGHRALTICLFISPDLDVDDMFHDMFRTARTTAKCFTICFTICLFHECLICLTERNRPLDTLAFIDTPH
jgi:hypothetical protein